MGLRLTVIGCAGSYPGPESPASCYLLEAEHQGRTWRILLDLGNGALGVLQRHADPLAIDGVFISHLHADHCLDLCGYYVMRKYHPTGPQPRIPVWGPTGTADRMAAAYDLPADPGMNEEFDFRVYGTQPVEIGPFVVEAVEVEHPIPAYALRVRAHGRTLVYSGDTARCDSLQHAAAGADLFLCEAAFIEEADNPPGIHLTGRDAGEVAAQAGVGRLLLTHIPAWHDPQTSLREASGVYRGPIDLARCGSSYQI